MTKQFLNDLNNILEKILKVNNVSDNAKIITEEEEESKQYIISIKENDKIVLNIMIVNSEILEALTQDTDKNNINEDDVNYEDEDITYEDDDDAEVDDEDENDNLLDNPYIIY